ncbi:MAG: 3-deoxy-D-manno-octulosonic acid transferase [Bacteroidetes bacterium]|nr:3-deoxy-D-manno-octulosonic acid transferase [Bacteroidota bacterium]
MILFYQIGILFFYLGVVIASLFNRKAKLFVAGRKNIFKTIADCLVSIPSGQLPTADWIWFHCSSLGEFEQARPLIEKYKVQSTKYKVVITFFSPSGYEIRKNYDGADLICYLPLDTKANAKKFISLLNPSQVFFVKYDFWFNFLNELHDRKIPTYLVSANFREEQFKGIYGNYLRRVLKFFTRIFVQNETSQKILSANGIPEAMVAGDLRFDRVAQTVSNPKKIPIVETFASSPNPSPAGEGSMSRCKVMVCGSTWSKDEGIISNFKLQTSNFKLIIAPHEISESHIQSIIQLFNHSTILLFSEISKEPVSSAMEKLKAANILLIDNIGMLSSLYQYADVAYIGGGFGAGIHNILEAVAFGVPVIFGPKHDKFPEAKELTEQGGGFSITDEKELERAMTLLLSDEKILKMASMVCKNFVMQRRGAAEKIADAVG